LARDNVKSKRSEENRIWIRVAHRARHLVLPCGEGPIANGSPKAVRNRSDRVSEIGLELGEHLAGALVSTRTFSMTNGFRAAAGTNFSWFLFRHRKPQF